MLQISQARFSYAANLLPKSADANSDQRTEFRGSSRVLDAREHPDVTAQLSPSSELAEKIERLFLIETVSFDWNCPQYITPRFTAAEFEQMSAQIRVRGA
jgi:hypothetical protein